MQFLKMTNRLFEIHVNCPSRLLRPESRLPPFGRSLVSHLTAEDKQSLYSRCFSQTLRQREDPQPFGRTCGFRLAEEALFSTLRQRGDPHLSAGPVASTLRKKPCFPPCGRKRTATLQQLFFPNLAAGKRSTPFGKTMSPTLRQKTNSHFAAAVSPEPCGREKVPTFRRDHNTILIWHYTAPVSRRALDLDRISSTLIKKYCAHARILTKNMSPRPRFQASSDTRAATTPLPKP